MNTSGASSRATASASSAERTSATTSMSASPSRTPRIPRPARVLGSTITILIMSRFGAVEDGSGAIKHLLALGVRASYEATYERHIAHDPKGPTSREPFVSRAYGLVPRLRVRGGS